MSELVTLKSYVLGRADKPRRVLRALEHTLELTIPRMSERDREADAGELDREHQTRTLSGAMASETLLEGFVRAIANVVPGVMIRRIEMKNVDYGRLRVLTRPPAKGASTHGALIYMRDE